MGETKRMKPQTSALTSDLFQTDPSAVWPLLPYLKPDWLIWEPAAGEKRIKNCLELEGFDVVASDIITGEDFFEFIPPLNMHDAIVTNPPYSVKDRWIERCYDLGKPFALLLPFTALEGIKRQKLYRQHGIDLLVLPKRVPFKTPSGRVGGAWFPCAWFTWKMLPERLIFAE